MLFSVLAWKLAKAFMALLGARCSSDWQKTESSPAAHKGITLSPLYLNDNVLDHYKVPNVLHYCDQ